MTGAKADHNRRLERIETLPYSAQVTTSAIVWDGQTVVLGGLITEDVTKLQSRFQSLKAEVARLESEIKELISQRATLEFSLNNKKSNLTVLEGGLQDAQAAAEKFGNLEFSALAAALRSYTAALVEDCPSAKAAAGASLAQFPGGVNLEPASIGLAICGEGVRAIIPLALDTTERDGLRRSANVLRAATASLMLSQGGDLRH